MRNLPKVYVVVLSLFILALSGLSVSAKTLLAGSFTLENPTQWKNTVLPAGKYTFRLAGTQTDTNVLKVHGANKNLDIMVFAQSACENCRSGALKVAVNGDNRVVTSLDLPGFHMDFAAPRSAAQREEESRKAPAASEQVAVHVDQN
jgi:hypothetical protein